MLSINSTYYLYLVSIILSKIRLTNSSSFKSHYDHDFLTSCHHLRHEHRLFSFSGLTSSHFHSISALELNSCNLSYEFFFACRLVESIAFCFIFFSGSVSSCLSLNILQNTLEEELVFSLASES